MPVDDALRAEIATLREAAAKAPPLPWGGDINGAFDTAHHSPVYVHAADGSVPVYCYGGGKIQRLEYVVAACNLAPKLADALEAAEQEREALVRFKAWVHDYLDSKSIPHHPPGTHGAEGCRIGDRMDHLFARLDASEREVERLRAAQERCLVIARSVELLTVDKAVYDACVSLIAALEGRDDG